MQSVVERRGAGSPSTTATAIFTATFTESCSGFWEGGEAYLELGCDAECC